MRSFRDGYYRAGMPWLLKGLLLAAKSKKGRELLFAASLIAIETARSKRARKMYATAWNLAKGRRSREVAADTARKITRRVKRAATP